MKKIAIVAAVLSVVNSAAFAGKNDLSASQKTTIIKNAGTIVAAMRKCDNLTVQPTALKVILAALKLYGVDVETTNAPTMTFMMSQMEFEANYKNEPGLTCKLALATFSAVLEYAK